MQPGLAPRCSFLVENAFCYGGIDALLCEPQCFASCIGVAGFSGGDRLAVLGSHLASNRLIALALGLVLTIALDLRFDIGHKKTPDGVGDGETLAGA